MIRLIASVLVLWLAAAVPALGQDWPSKPVRFIVPFPPGGSVDPLACLLGAKLADLLKTQFGQIDMCIGSVALLSPQARGGKMRAIATTGHQRAQALPDVRKTLPRASAWT